MKTITERDKVKAAAAIARHHLARDASKIEGMMIVRRKIPDLDISNRDAAIVLAAIDMEIAKIRRTQ